jgi:hypothetical protein
MAYFEVVYKKEWTNGATCNSWDLGTQIVPIDKANIFADWLENQLIPHDFRDWKHK